ncbi:MAG TPA: DNA replication and repair protein RecF [Levilinea sp.]|nr:DNA replication and repair protein RecF [Levilinea sp.]
MYLTHLSLTDYRAFTRLDMDVPRRILLLVGDNAQGKTSILEAVYYLATFTSCHAASDRQLVNFMASSESLAVGRLVADYRRGQSSHRIEVRLIQESGNGGARLRKEILLDGVRKTAQTAMGHFTAVIFLPQMTRIVEGAPEERRRYLNLALSQALPGYARDLSEYSQLLAQRNALLKQLSERSGDADQLVYWDELLAQRGAAIMYARIQAVCELEYAAIRIHHRLTSAQEVLRLQYLPAYDPLPQPNGQYTLPLAAQIDLKGISQEQLHRGFRQRLESLRREEIARGMTTVGPHRDDLRVIANSVDLGYYGSRGQVRTALLALKLAEVSWLQAKTGHWPVLLLDEIMAELDLQRRGDVLSALADCEQALLTTTDLRLFSSDFVKDNTVWQVTGGQVNAIPADF